MSTSENKKTKIDGEENRKSKSHACFDRVYYGRNVWAIGGQQENSDKECIDCQDQISEDFSDVFHILFFTCIEEAFLFFGSEALVS